MLVCDLWLWFGQYVIFYKTTTPHHTETCLNLRVSGYRHRRRCFFFRRLTTYNYLKCTLDIPTYTVHKTHTSWLIFFLIFFSSPIETKRTLTLECDKTKLSNEKRTDFFSWLEKKIGSEVKSKSETHPKEMFWNQFWLKIGFRTNKASRNYKFLRPTKDKWQIFECTNKFIGFRRCVMMDANMKTSNNLLQHAV